MEMCEEPTIQDFWRMHNAVLGNMNGLEDDAFFAFCDRHAALAGKAASNFSAVLMVDLELLESQVVAALA